MLPKRALNKLIFKFMWKYKGSRIAETILKGKSKAEGFPSPDFKLYYKATVVETV